MAPDPPRDPADRRTVDGSNVLSGVGNVYRAEVLFRNRINPHRPGNKLSRRSWRGIWADLVELMPQGVVNNRIDTVRPEHTPEAMGRPPRKR
jgi:Formamidopyrimidine-DNA glycosylase